MTIRKFFYGLGLFTFFIATFQHLAYRLVWTGFAVAFLVAADHLKSIERAKWKTRMETEYEMKKKELLGWEASLDSRYNTIVTQMGNVLDKVSFAVKDASPTRVAYHKLPDDSPVVQSFNQDQSNSD